VSRRDEPSGIWAYTRKNQPATIGVANLRQAQNGLLMYAYVNNNKHKVITSEVLTAVGCVCWLKDLRIKNVFSLDLKTDSQSLPMTDAGSEFQTYGASGASHRKERFAKSGVSERLDEQWRSRRALCPFDRMVLYVAYTRCTCSAILP